MVYFAAEKKHDLQQCYLECKTRAEKTIDPGDYRRSCSNWVSGKQIIQEVFHFVEMGF